MEIGTEVYKELKQMRTLKFLFVHCIRTASTGTYQTGNLISESPQPSFLDKNTVKQTFSYLLAGNAFMISGSLNIH